MKQQWYNKVLHKFEEVGKELEREPTFFEKYYDKAEDLFLEYVEYMPVIILITLIICGTGAYYILDELTFAIVEVIFLLFILYLILLSF